MLKRVGLIAVAASLAALAVVASGFARPSTVAATSASSALSCKKGVSLGMLAPITGPAGSIGSDQLHWAEFYVTQWNKVKGHVKIKLVQGDTQLDPSKASTVAQSFASNNSIVGVIGPAGSDEVQAVAPILRKGGLAFASGSATRVSLTNGTWKGYFFRDVPNDGVQGPTAGNYMFSKLGLKSGDSVMVVDDQESYSTGLADIVGQNLSGKGVKVDRESISQKDTDFSSLVAKVTSATKVVYLPFQLAAQAQLFAQQLKAQGKTAVVFGSDGTFDSSKFNVSGSYISFFAPDVTTIPADAKIVAAFHKQFPGATSPFGAPNYVLAQMYSTAITKSCANGTISRAELRANFAKVSLPTTILGTPIRFTANGDLAGAKFHIFKIVNGKYETVQ
jgi:branched-chain amino acid transport system substrate-binding protein